MENVKNSIQFPEFYPWLGWQQMLKAFCSNSHDSPSFTLTMIVLFLSSPSLFLNHFIVRVSYAKHIYSSLQNPLTYSFWSTKKLLQTMTEPEPAPNEDAATKDQTLIKTDKTEQEARQTSVDPDSSISNDVKNPLLTSPILPIRVSEMRRKQEPWKLFQ